MEQLGEQFEISIDSCSNATWQGKARYLGQEYRFISGLELFMLMERLLKGDPHAKACK